MRALKRARVENYPVLRKEFRNAEGLSEGLKLGYKTVGHHLDIMVGDKVVIGLGVDHEENYFWTDEMTQNRDELKGLRSWRG